MEADEARRSPRAWRDRLAGQVPFDGSAAETAIRRAYGASNLAEPGQVLWVKGPREAAQAIAFLERPPRKLRRTAWAVLILGTIAWIGLALGIAGTWPTIPTPLEAAAWSIVLAGFGLTLGGWHRLPAWPGMPAGGRNITPILLGGVVFLALASHSFVLQRLGGLPADRVEFAIALVLAALVGALPAAFFAFRIRRAYAHLPRSLRDLATQRSVGRRLERAQEKVWTLFQRTLVRPRSRDLLAEAYHVAHREAFAARRADLVEFCRWLLADVSVSLQAEAFGVPPHLDGIADSARVASVEHAGATGAAAAFAELAFHVDRLYPFETIAVAGLPATTVALDAEGRPHAEHGPALAWADGTQIFAWHGRLVSAEAIDPSLPITQSRINREADPDRRWVLIERYGLGRYLLEAGASEIQRDDCGQLYRLALPLSEPILAVRVVNHTPEPDASFREFWLCVPPTMTTARQAVAWTFDLPAEDYDPVAQS